LITKAAHIRPELCAVVVHIGKELEERFKISGMTVKSFASRIGRSPKNIYELFERPSIDTQILKKASEALHYNFFKLYCDDLDTQMGLTRAEEQQAKYARTEPTVIVIQGTNIDPDLIDRITKAAKK
jgi:transcriptional regulator with XRE-family HTH domain